MKKGIEKNNVITETMKEKFNADKENNAFFSEIAEAAENTAEIKANVNQFININRNKKKLL
ncbi:MAG: hypothetical protein STSR0008_14710 [Ignavibacterium sp.]